MARMDKKWVVLCSTAIMAVYVAGYVTTDTQASILQSSQMSQVKIEPSDASPIGKQSSVSPSNQDQPKVSKPTSEQHVSQYKSGTYTGMGSNRRGSIEVAVTIGDDKITDVEVSHFAMHYSESDIVDLPDEVLKLQNARVGNVSGATYSTRAFTEAVQAALTQAKNG